MAQLLNDIGLPVTRVAIEVTEGTLLDNAERVRTVLEQLRLAGVGAALDDFGTGYSSLSYLHTLPLRMLKIDQSFVQGLDKTGNTSSARAVEAILARARALDIQVIAAGIETDTQRGILLAMGCAMCKGCLLGHPEFLRRSERVNVFPTLGVRFLCNNFRQDGVDRCRHTACRLGRVEQLLCIHGQVGIDMHGGGR